MREGNGKISIVEAGAERVMYASSSHFAAGLQAKKKHLRYISRVAVSCA